MILETGPLSSFLYHGLVEREVPVTCVCARHAKGVLSARVNKSDPHDAEGLAQMARTGWFKEVRIKQEATHMDRARLKIREQLITAHNAMAGQLRGLLKLFGLRLGKVTTPNKRRERLIALFALKPELEPIMTPLIESLEALETQIARASKALAAAAAADPVAARLMSVPGGRTHNRAGLQDQYRRPGPVHAGRGRRGLRGLGSSAQPVGRTGRERPHLQGRRSHAALGPLRVRQQPAQPRQTALRPTGLGQASRRGQGR